MKKKENFKNISKKLKRIQYNFNYFIIKDAVLITCNHSADENNYENENKNENI